MIAKRVAVVLGCIGLIIGTLWIYNSRTDTRPKLTYRGSLHHLWTESVNTRCDFMFRRYATATGGAEIGPAVYRGDIAIQDGRFSVSLPDKLLDQATASAPQPWIEIALRCSDITGDFTAVMRPRLLIQGTENWQAQDSSQLICVLPSQANAADHSEGPSVGGDVYTLRAGFWADDPA